MKIFVFEADDFLESRICELLAPEHEVLGTMKNKTSEKHNLSQVVPNDSEKIKGAILSADIIIFNLKTTIQDALFALKVLVGTSYQDTKTFILISSLMTWALTKKKYEQEDEPEPDAAQQAENADPDNPQPVVPPTSNKPKKRRNYDPLTEENSVMRQPHQKYLEFMEIEKRARKAESKTLRTFVLAPGFTYGCGEDLFHPFFRNAWEGGQLVCPGDGGNFLPMIHVKDLSQIVKKIVDEPPQGEEEAEENPKGGQYYVCVDEAQLTLKDVLSTIQKEFKVPSVEFNLDENSVALEEVNDKLTLDLKFAPGAVNQFPFEWTSKEGFKEHIKKIRKEYEQTRKLSAMKIALFGGPAAGKTTYAKKIAEKFKIPVLTLKDVITQFFNEEKELTKQLEDIVGEKERKKKLAQEKAASAAAAAADPSAEPAAPVPEAQPEEEAPEDENSPTTKLKKRIELFKKVREMKATLAKNEANLVSVIPGVVDARLNSQALAVIYQWRLEKRDCVNKGFVLDGFPKTPEECKELLKPQNYFKELDAVEGEADPAAEDDGSAAPGTIKAHKNYLPEFVVVLTLPDNLLDKRIAAMHRDAQDKHTTDASFKRRRENYKKNFALEKDGSVVSLFEAAILIGEKVAAQSQPTVVKEIKCEHNGADELPENIFFKICEFLGEPHNYGPTQEEQKQLDEWRKNEEQKVQERAKRKQEEEEQKRKTEEEKKQKIKQQNEEKVKNIQEEEKQVLEARSEPLRAYLMKHVMPMLNEGLAEICQTQPKDPIDALAEYLIRRAKEMGN